MLAKLKIILSDELASFWLGVILFLFWAFVLLTILGGCRAPRQAQQTVNTDSTVVIRDTVVVIQENSDTFWLPLPLPIDTVIHSAIKQGRSKASLHMSKTSDNVLRAVCNEDAYKLKLDSVIQVKNKVTTVTTTQLVAKCDSKFHIFATYFSVIAIGVVLLLGIVKSGLR